jgi:hypothetical protein
MVFTKVLLSKIGELSYEISEGLNNGISDFEIVFKDSTARYMNKYLGPEIGSMFLLT